MTHKCVQTSDSPWEWQSQCQTIVVFVEKTVIKSDINSLETSGIDQKM